MGPACTALQDHPGPKESRAYLETHRAPTGLDGALVPGDVAHDALLELRKIRECDVGPFEGEAQPSDSRPTTHFDDLHSPAVRLGQGPFKVLCEHDATVPHPVSCGWANMRGSLWRVM